MISLRISRDLDYNKALYARGLPDDPWVGDHHTFWVARTPDGEPVGFCSAVFLPHETGIFLSSAVVFRAFRGSGLQRRMIQRRLAWAKRHGATHAVTYTIVGNWPSVASLLRCGFHAYDPHWAWVGRAWYFKRELV